MDSRALQKHYLTAWSECLTWFERVHDYTWKRSNSIGERGMIERINPDLHGHSSNISVRRRIGGDSDDRLDTQALYKFPLKR